MKEYNKKIIVLVLVVTFIFSPFFARKAEAQWIVLDPTNLVQSIMKIVKDFGLDSLAWMIVNRIIERMTAATVNWINSGFEGQPAYLTDPQAYFTNMGDQLAGQFIFSDKRLNALCGPINAKIRLTLLRNYRNDKEWQCTPSLVGTRMEDFMGDFTKGGWDTFFDLSQKTQNNPIGAYLQAEGVLRDTLTQKQQQTLTELNQGSGMLSWKECEQYGVAINARDITLPDGTIFHVPASPAPCIKEKTNTPGSVINERLNDQLGAGQGKLEVADEINEMISALLNQLINKVFSSVAGGLRGTSARTSTGGSSFMEDLSNSTGEGLYGPPDTSVADKSAAIDPYAGAPANPTQSWPDADLEQNMKDYFEPTQPQETI